MKIFLIAVIAFLLYNSPPARDSSADVLRNVADFVDTKPQNTDNPKHFQIPNPFHQ
jgi:hypothetical protein